MVLCFSVCEIGFSHTWYQGPLSETVCHSLSLKLPLLMQWAPNSAVWAAQRFGGLPSAPLCRQLQGHSCHPTLPTALIYICRWGPWISKSSKEKRTSSSCSFWPLLSLTPNHGMTRGQGSASFSSCPPSEISHIVRVWVGKLLSIFSGVLYPTILLGLWENGREEGKKRTRREKQTERGQKWAFPPF